MMISHLSVLAKNFYAGCPSCRNPPHLSGLGTGIKRHKKSASDGYLLQRETKEKIFRCSKGRYAGSWCEGDEC